MTKPLQKKSIRSRTSFPSRISSHSNCIVEDGSSSGHNKKLHIITTIVGATLFLLSVPLLILMLIPNMQFQSLIIADIVVYGLSTVIVAIGWLFGYPIGRIFVSYKMENTTVPYTHPVVIRFIKKTSGATLGAYFLNFMVLIAAKNVDHDLGEKAKASAVMAFGHTTFVGICFFIYFYGFDFNTNIEKIAAKYELTTNVTKLEMEMEMQAINIPNNNNTVV